MKLPSRSSLLLPVFLGTYLVVGLILGAGSLIFLGKASGSAYYFFLIFPLGFVVALCFPALFVMGLISRILGTNEIVSSVIMVVLCVTVITSFLFLYKKIGKQKP